MTEDPRPIGPDISGWIGQPPPEPATHWHRQRAQYLMPLVVNALASLGYESEELEDLDLEDALTLTLRVAQQFASSPLAGMQESAVHLGLAAVALQGAVSLGNALPHLANVQIILALKDFVAAQGEFRAASRPVGTTQKVRTA